MDYRRDRQVKVISVNSYTRFMDALSCLARILHEGGRGTIDSERSQEIRVNQMGFKLLQIVRVVL